MARYELYSQPLGSDRDWKSSGRLGSRHSTQSRSRQHRCRKSRVLAKLASLRAERDYLQPSSKAKIKLDQIKEAIDNIG